MMLCTALILAVGNISVFRHGFWAYHKDVQAFSTETSAAFRSVDGCVLMLQCYIKTAANFILTSNCGKYSVHLQALINMLDMPTASHELTSALTSVLHNVALGSVDGCVLMLQGGVAIAAAVLLTSNGPHDDQQDARVAALIQQICMKVPQAEVRRRDLKPLSWQPAEWHHTNHVKTSSERACSLGATCWPVSSPNNV